MTNKKTLTTMIAAGLALSGFAFDARKDRPTPPKSIFNETAEQRDARRAWWVHDRFGMFIHFGLYALPARHEWVQSTERISPASYESRYMKYFDPDLFDAREWARSAKAAGMKYMVLTTRHHEGFSLWDSKANPFNSVNYGPHRDIVREFVDACREFDLKIGFYSSLMDWHHPDGWKCAFDNEARKRFTDYIEALNTELLTNYGKIDILWYDVSWPMESWEGWDSLVRNQHLRALQPDIIINDRSKLEEDFGTPEGAVVAGSRDWEACMTFNDISWGYVDEKQALPYAYTAPRILKMLSTCAKDCGNLLLNIGPKPDGSVPADAVEPLTQVGQWLSRNGECAYGKLQKTAHWGMGNGVCSTSTSADGRKIYLWNWIWPHGGTMGFGGYTSAPKRVYTLCDGKDLDFEFKGQRIILKNLPETSPDPLGVTVLCFEFDEPPVHHVLSYYPQTCGGVDWAGENKI